MTRYPLLAAVCVFVLLGTASGRGQSPSEADMAVSSLARNGQLFVSFEIGEALPADVRERIQSGLATTFLYDVELRSGSATWFARPIAALTVAATVRFDNLTRRYELTRSVDGRVEETRPTEDPDAVARWLTHVERIPVSRTSALEANAEYSVHVRARIHARTNWFPWPWDRRSALGRATFTFIP